MERAAAARSNAVIAACALLALAAGVLVYWSDRDPARSTLIPAAAMLAGSVGFGVLGQWLPSFVHSLAFGLLTAVALPPRFMPRAAACASWAVLNIAFESGQHPRVAAAWRTRFGDGWLGAYFERGTFDVGDIVAALLGAVVAIGVIVVSGSTSRNSDEEA